MRIMPLIMCWMMIAGAVMAQEVVTKLDVVGQGIINEELRRTRSSTSANGASIVSIQADLASKFTSNVLNVANGGTGQTTVNNALNAFLPAQGSASGKYLTTNGTNTSWGVPVDAYTNGAVLSSQIASTERTIDPTGTYTKIKELTPVQRSGAVTTSYECGQGYADHADARTRIHINGVAAGSEYNWTVAYTVRTDALTVVKGDVIAVYVKDSQAGQISCKNLKILSGNPTLPGEVTNY